MEVYTVTKIFGVDAIKTRVFRNKKDAEADIQETISLFMDYPSQVEVINKENEETYYLINKSDKPEDYIAFVLRRNEVK